MFIGRRKDKEVVVCIHNRILLSYKMECIWVSSNEVDKPRAYYTEWSKWKRKRKTLYIYEINKDETDNRTFKAAKETQM